MSAARVSVLLFLLGWLGSPSGPLTVASQVQVIRMASNRFNPAEVTARPGDTLRFINGGVSGVSGVSEVGGGGGGGLHNIQFVSDSVPESMRQLLERAMGGGSDKLGPVASPLLLDAGASYQFEVPRLLPGRYPFVCQPHFASNMRGVLVVPR